MKKIFVLTGEPSGDKLASKVISKLKNSNSDIEYLSVGGENLKGWKGFSAIRFNRYLKDQIMSKHVDFIHDLFTGDKRGIPILSIVGVLNDDYEGGEFIMFDDYEIKFKAGDIILFPSTFLYPHLVKPVKKGIRYAFVSWCY